MMAALAGQACAVDQPSGGIEPWANKALSVTDGLVVWLDAAKQNEARRQHGQPELRDGDLVDCWYDASGNRIDVQQHNADWRPKLRRQGDLGFVCFDGQHSSLWRDGLNHSFREPTIFIVAAPYSNPGNFRALLATNAKDREDFRSGINIDQGSQSTSRFEVINAEGVGFGGALNLRYPPVEFRRLERICVSPGIGLDGTALFINGKAQGTRDRTESIIQMDQLVVGARYYGGFLGIRGLFAGEIAEVLIYDRKLNDNERAAVDRYLADKYAAVKEVPEQAGPPGSKPLRSVENPPPVQVFVPGFAVKQLPVDLPNINNVLYRDDGKLVALGYNGNVYLLSDTDGDGLEDNADVFFENKGQLRAPIGMALTPSDYQRGRGIFVPSKGKCSLIVDTNRDDVADEEIIVADGWKEGPNGVDALGVDVDRRDGSVYFALGCQDFRNAYVVGADGKAGYRLNSERGTIMRVAPDFKSRKIVATGIRFPVGIRFNHLGDLFCTEQEGATWLANGNPLDELLQIDLEKPKHYGFPPRHPRHLPEVIDEPSVFDYAPQHQSTCGLNFNESAGGGPAFGPAWWQHDVFVTGYSRGKLYRTKLAKTAAGYVAQNQLLATTNMLLTDACPTPDGSLVMATHSGAPDWGSGPTGKGKLFKVTYANKQAPIPVLAWPQTPHEVRVVFDREVDLQTLKDVAAKAAIDRGQFVSAGDQFESQRPGYAVVDRQINTPRYDHKIHGVQLTPDRRMLILSTAQHVAAVNYGLMLPGLGRTANENATNGELPQHPETNLLYDLSGVEAAWQPGKCTPHAPREETHHAEPDDDTQQTWTGWLPHLDFTAARAFTTGSIIHDEFWQRCRQPGTLTLRTQLHLKDMLRPTVQPGAKIDYEWPPEDVTVVLESNVDMEVKLGGKAFPVKEEPAEAKAAGKWIAQINVSAAATEKAHPLELRLRNGSSDFEPQLAVTYRTNEDSRPRALQARRFLLPWASMTKQVDLVVDNRNLPELKGGNWLRGRKVFFSEQAACSKCHKVRGEGGSIGADLSNLTQRDYASVLRDITEPSFAINPDFVGQTLALVDGRSLVGSIRSKGNQLIVGDKDGRETVVNRDEIESIHPSSLSIMPQGLPKLIGPDNMRDLLTFLLVEPPKMPNYDENQ